MAKTKYFVKKGLKLSIFFVFLAKNLKVMATGLGWLEKSEILLVTPEVHAQSWLAHHKDF